MPHDIPLEKLESLWLSQPVHDGDNDWVVAAKHDRQRMLRRLRHEAWQTERGYAATMPEVEVIPVEGSDDPV